jgi:hypothetical protein
MAYAGACGGYNISNGTVYQVTNPNGTSGSTTGLTSNGVLNGGLGGLSQGSNNQSNGLAGQTGNYCPLSPFAISTPFYLPFGSGGGGGANSVACATYAAPFAGGGQYGLLGQAACMSANQTYYNPVLAGVTNAVSATGGHWNSNNTANDSTYQYSRAASNSGAGGGSAQAQGYGGLGGSGIVILAIPTSCLI